MDLKSTFLTPSVILFLGLWQSIYCQDCHSDIYFDYSKYFRAGLHCNIKMVCEGTTAIYILSSYSKLIHSGDNYNRHCSSWTARVTLRNICQSAQDGTLITMSENINFPDDARNFIEFDIVDSACSSIPTFVDFPNVEVIQMHNTNLEDFSYTSNVLHKLSVLDVSQNVISHINNLDLSSSSNLEVLNVSYNAINIINDQVFRNISSLKTLDLSSNRIDNISSKSFYGLHNLNILHLSHNEISDINSAFENLVELEEIYLDHNRLYEIKENSFKGLKNLKILQLDSNAIIKFDWTTMDYMPLLKMLDVSNNSIKNLREIAFENNNLYHFDLSFNNITRLSPNVFAHLNISFFAIQNNSLEGDVEFGMFEGMPMVRKLDLSYQRIESIGDRGFYGLTRLSKLLLNDNKIKNITKTAFRTLVDLELLDLSNNLLRVIEFDNNDLTSLKTLRLQNNLIANINFGQITNLEVLDLSQNNLSSFITYNESLPQLQQLNISHNSLKIIQDDIFYKFVNLLQIDLTSNRNLTIVFNTLLKNNADIKQKPKIIKFSVTNCDMDSVNFLESNIFSELLSLDFAHNQMPNIEYGMFSRSKGISYLDLSYNKISHIQPGSFKDNNELRELKIAHNELIKLEYGSFLGLNKLNILDISFNKIKSLKHGRFYETSNLKTLIADNNSIESVEYEDFVGASLSTLSIGGNPLACIVLINLKTETHNLKVTSINLELHLPNFQGVTCNQESNHNEKNFSITNTYDNDLYSERREVILEDIRNILLEIKRENYSGGFDPDKISSFLLQMSNLTDSINRALYKLDETSNRLVDKILELKNNSKLDKRLDYLKKQIASHDNKSFEPDEAMMHFDKLQNNLGEQVQPTQTVTTLSDVCLVFITVILLCFMTYKIYELNLLSLLRRRRTSSTQYINESIATATL